MAPMTRQYNNLFTGCWLLLALLLTSGRVRAQVPAIDQQLAAYHTRTLVEKVYLHTDRSAYLAGETMWYKLYVVDGAHHRPLPLSTVAYVEVLNADNQPVAQGRIALRGGRGHGAFSLPDTLGTGRYHVRAYTHWMQNFDPAYFFNAPVDILAAVRSSAGALPVGLTAANYDAQFFPEGGQLVQGLPSKIGFKLTDRQGQGVAARGVVVDQVGQQVAEFTTLRFGMGSFEFTPVLGSAAYTAVLTLHSGEVLRRPLPAAQPTGYTLRLLDETPTQLRLVVRAAPTVSAPVLLLQHTRQLPPVLSKQPLVDGAAEFVVSKQALADGITHFTVFTANQQPVCERLYFKAPAQLTIQAQTAVAYSTRQRVELALRTATPQGQAMPANLSVAVYHLDSLTSIEAAPALVPYLWLTSDLRGHVEQPSFYLSAAPDAATAADNLMLTQGWQRFAWADVLAPVAPLPTYAPELHGPLVRGTVFTRGTNAPRGQVPVYLASPGKAGRLYNDVSRPDGTILFELKDFYGPRELVVQPNNEVDSAYYVTLQSPYSSAYLPTTAFALTRLGISENVLTQRYLQRQLLTAYYPDRQIRTQYPLPDTATFYGHPDYSYRLDEYTRFKTMEEVMREYVRGVTVRNRRGRFHFMLYNKTTDDVFKDDPMVLLDGVPIFNLNTVMALDPLKVKQVDVITSQYIQGQLTYNGLVSYSTYKGDLQGLPLDARALLQTYEGLQIPREFYAPRYDTNQAKQSRLPDFRNLLYWNPEVVTGPDGKQQVEFYTSDQPGTYRVVVQGLSANGLAGSTSYTFEVKRSL
ncbi:hypothetical protein F1C16_09415 [Hymenobacter sp. NBH84]|uniref:MG2 domain-containing protein n=1 Tax=Hymenobacter sp. NBH84 TaxID=2596915 RepID=UPI001625DC90|nr:MG2 domain-containing protein [Hymenobacter sp. NBH84]QNE39757.1 hypothetical protein F1C16_09415 [Hymenobacter sp. NBH84]